MDEKVNVFLKEIGDFESTDVPNMPSNPQSCAWQECFDETTGYPYYWNMETNAVTWEMPAEYKVSLNVSNAFPTSVRKNTNFLPPRTSLIPNKVSRKSEVATSRLVYRTGTTSKVLKKKLSNSNSRRRFSDSDDEKIELITSYGEDSDSEDESPKRSIKSAGSLPNPAQPLPKVPLGPTIIYRIQPESQIIYPKPTSDTEILDYNLKAPPVALQTIVNKFQKESQEKSIQLVDCEKDDTIILHQLRTQAKVLQDLGGEIPHEIEKLIEPPIDDIIAQIEREQPPDLPKIINKSTEQSVAKIPNCKPIFSLVAGYSDASDEEDEQEEVVVPLKPLFPITDTPITSLPIQQSSQETNNQLDASDNTEGNENSDPKPFEAQSKLSYIDNNASDESLDTKAFKRKRRIALDVLPVKYKKTDALLNPTSSYIDPISTGHAGFGFQQSKDEDTTKEEQTSVSNKYKKGAISFVKAETLNGSKEEAPPPKDDFKKGDDDLIDGLDDLADIIKEKALFLGEGKDPVSAVQLMTIQLDTLLAARKANALTNKYLHMWLKATATDLNKLERDATPSGWLCQWDRSNKRYFYRNQQTGHTQWEYPVAGIAGGAEAMDICMTPPPPDDGGTSLLELPGQEQRTSSPTVDPVAIIGPAPQTPPPPSVSPPPQPPPPPRITRHSPSPPPPPKISQTDYDHSLEILTQTDDIQLPPLPGPSEAPIQAVAVSEPFQTMQPLPPGVDPPELLFVVAGPNSNFEPKLDNDEKTNLGSELESFYSDIASLEVTVPTAEIEQQKETVVNATKNEKSLDNEMMSTTLRKKKKPKATKLASGLTLKKKEVSLLVEKWKKVQHDF